MGTVIVVVALVALAAGTWWWMRGAPRASDAAPAAAAGAKPAPVPLRVTAPRRFARDGDRKVWELHSPSSACEPARTRNGAKYKADDAPVLPLPGCVHTNCTCHYVALKERRTWFRRRGEDRRDGVRFEPKKDRIDRRARDRRKAEAGWDDDKRPL